MLEEILFLHHAVLNNPTTETISAGLGPAGQYGIILIILLIVLIYLIRKKKD